MNSKWWKFFFCLSIRSISLFSVIATRNEQMKKVQNNGKKPLWLANWFRYFQFFSFVSIFSLFSKIKNCLCSISMANFFFDIVVSVSVWRRAFFSSISSVYVNQMMWCNRKSDCAMPLFSFFFLHSFDILYQTVNCFFFHLSFVNFFFEFISFSVIIDSIWHFSDSIWMPYF